VSTTDPSLGFDSLLEALKAAAEPTRLRMLALLARTELTVSDLTRILGQSQPRVSRHLKLMDEAGLLERHREGAWVFYRLAGPAVRSGFAQVLAAFVAGDDPVIARDLARLDGVRAARAEAAAAYFRASASRWDEIRALYVPEEQVEQAIAAIIGPEPVGDVVDLGTGTGRVLALLAARAQRAVGIDASPEMLTIARAALDAAGLAQAQVRLGDLYNLPMADASADLVTVHHVLHFLEDPAAAVAEAARVLRPGGRLLMADFAPHDIESLRTDHAHRRLGFADREVRAWCEAAGLTLETTRALEPGEGTGRITVMLWLARRRAGRARTRLEAA